MKLDEKNLIEIIANLQKRLLVLERRFYVPIQLEQYALDGDVPSHLVYDGYVYYNTTTNKVKVRENSSWKTVTTS